MAQNLSPCPTFSPSFINCGLLMADKVLFLAVAALIGDWQWLSALDIGSSWLVSVAQGLILSASWVKTSRLKLTSHKNQPNLLYIWFRRLAIGP